MPVILATREVAVRRISVGGQPRQRVETPSQPIKAGLLVCTCHPSYMGSISRRISVQASWGINKRPYSKNNLSKPGWWCG
jgi:hypothetical protein